MQERGNRGFRIQTGVYGTMLFHARTGYFLGFRRMPEDLGNGIIRVGNELLFGFRFFVSEITYLMRLEHPSWLRRRQLEV